MAAGADGLGEDFYDPALELMKEPRLPGSSFSFTADGYYEEALYLVVSNRAFPTAFPTRLFKSILTLSERIATRPGCPTALLQWQHGQYTVHANGSLTLAPIKVDGRQLFSDPCNYDRSIYTRYNQTELYKVCFFFHPPSPPLHTRQLLTGVLLCEKKSGTKSSWTKPTTRNG